MSKNSRAPPEEGDGDGSGEDKGSADEPDLEAATGESNAPAHDPPIKRCCVGCIGMFRRSRVLSGTRLEWKIAFVSAFMAACLAVALFKFVDLVIVAEWLRFVVIAAMLIVLVLALAIAGSVNAPAPPAWSSPPLESIRTDAPRHGAWHGVSADPEPDPEAEPETEPPVNDRLQPPAAKPSNRSRTPRPNSTSPPVAQRQQQHQSRSQTSPAAPKKHGKPKPKKREKQ